MNETMKIIFAALVGALIALLAVIYTAKETPPNKPVKTEAQILADDIINNYQIVVIDGCEYIIYYQTKTGTGVGYKGFGYMAHKGDCSNPIHKHNIQKE
jgi:hypothetical protein